MNPSHLAKNAKAYAALVGSLVTVLLTVAPVDGNLHAALVVLGILATAVSTWRVPNAPAE